VVALAYDKNKGNISWALKQMKNSKLKVLFGRLKNHLAGQT